MFFGDSGSIAGGRISTLPSTPFGTYGGRWKTLQS